MTHPIIEEIKRVEMSFSMQETLAESKKTKKDFNARWRAIKALRVHLENKFYDQEPVKKPD